MIMFSANGTIQCTCGGMTRVCSCDCTKTASVPLQRHPPCRICHAA